MQIPFDAFFWDFARSAFVPCARSVELAHEIPVVMIQKCERSGAEKQRLEKTNKTVVVFELPSSSYLCFSAPLRSHSPRAVDAG
jgi:hypothetical protein